VRVRYISAAIALLVSLSAWAVCKQWVFNGDSAHFANPSAAFDAHVTTSMAAWNSGNAADGFSDGFCNNGYTSPSPAPRHCIGIVTVYPTDNGTTVTNSPAWKVRVEDRATHALNYEQALSAAFTSSNCPTSGACPSNGEKITAVWPVGTSPGTGMCSPRGGGCYATVGSDGVTLIMQGGPRAVGTATYTNQSCDYTHTVSTAQANDQSALAQGGSVGEVNGSCGYVNGDGMCPGSGDHGCTIYASGGTMCVVGSVGAVPPDNGTPGVPATPSAVLTNNTTSATYNYYGPAVVAGSSAPVEAVAAGGGPLGGPGGGVANSPGTCAGSGCVAPTSSAVANGDCDAADGRDCSATGDAQLPSADADPGAFQESTQGLVDGIRASDLYSAVSGISTSLPSGSCPSASFTIWGSSFDFMTSGCALWTDHMADILSACMLAVYAIGALWILLSA
jgi:hypothetical protein